MGARTVQPADRRIETKLCHEVTHETHPAFQTAHVPVCVLKFAGPLCLMMRADICELNEFETHFHLETILTFFGTKSFLTQQYTYIRVFAQKYFGLGLESSTHMTFSLCSVSRCQCLSKVRKLYYLSGSHIENTLSYLVCVCVYALDKMLYKEQQQQPLSR